MVIGEQKTLDSKGVFLQVELKVPVSYDYEFEQWRIIWTREYFWKFVSEFSGLALSVYATIKFIMSFFYGHQQIKSMVGSLYSDDGNLCDRVSTRDET